MSHIATMSIDIGQEFAELLERHRKIVVKVANTYTRHAEDRADLAQEIAAQLWRAYPKYDTSRPFSTWMYRIALNVGISFLRAHGQRQRQTVPLDDGLHESVDDGPDHESEQQVRILHRRLQLDNSLKLHDLRERKLDKTRGSLRALFRGQVAQILLFGIPVIALAALLWMSQPAHASVIVAGIVLHAYGVLTIIAAGVVLGQLGKIDYAVPVLEIQSQLARVRVLYIRSGMIAGLPWWFLWIVMLMVLAGLGDVDLLAKAPWLVCSGLGIGAIGLFATWWFQRWSRRPERADFGRKLDDTLTGGSLRKAQAQLEELARFEQE